MARLVNFLFFIEKQTKKTHNKKWKLKKKNKKNEGSNREPPLPGRVPCSVEKKKMNKEKKK